MLSGRSEDERRHFQWPSILIMRREQTGHCMIWKFRKTSQIFVEKQAGQNQAYVKVS